MHLRFIQISALMMSASLLGATGCASEAEPAGSQESTPEVLESSAEADTAGEGEARQEDAATSPEGDASEDSESSTGVDTEAGPEEDSSGPCVPSCVGLTCGDDAGAAAPVAHAPRTTTLHRRDLRRGHLHDLLQRGEL